MSLGAVIRPFMYAAVSLTMLIGLTGITVPRFSTESNKRAQRGAAETQIVFFREALRMYADDLGTLPTTQQGLKALITAPERPVQTRWQGPYLKHVTIIPHDPWDNDYVYRFYPATGAYYLVSYADDGSPGGKGDAADLVRTGRIR